MYPESFVIYIGRHYIRLENHWCHKFNNSADKSKWLSTENIYNSWVKMNIPLSQKETGFEVGKPTLTENK